MDQRSAISDSEGAATTALLRAPAGVAAGAFIIGLITGAFARPASAPPRSALVYVVTLIVCVPFLLPTAWYRRHRSLWMWMAGAAAIATMRAVILAGWLLPYRPLDAWIVKTVVDLLVAGTLWLAVWVLKPLPSRHLDPR